MVNWGSNCINPSKGPKMKYTLKFEVDDEVWQGQNCIKAWNQSGVQLK